MSGRPPWLDRKITLSRHGEMDRLLREKGLSTVCREACCPNVSECYGRGEATFLILGRECTRRCSFCAVGKGSPLPPDPDEPLRVAEAVATLSLRHVVITSPTRDDLPDGGSSHFAATVGAIRRLSPGTGIELLIPDFAGDPAAVATVTGALPDVAGHNVETVPRLYGVREGADYHRSLSVLKRLAQTGLSFVKSGLMLGLGERDDEVIRVMEDLRESGTTLLSLGQYLPPSRRHVPVREYVHPDRFALLAEKGRSLGFTHVESGPYVRSSWNAGGYTKKDNSNPFSLDS